MAVMLTNAGGGQAAVTTESVGGDNATEALADLLMGPGGAVLLPGLIGVVVRRGIDVMWMAQPRWRGRPGPIQHHRAEDRTTPA
ncbi:hypothetical protein [Streptomyces sp. NPDC127197]|uniref:hypothetical protein n=1 Tax=Streptomyces sp. NPDC127197 TaxID=3345388 RepID=UPI00363AF48F